MDEHLDSMRRIIQLVDTGYEAIRHITLRMEAGYWEEDYYLISDILEAFNCSSRHIAKLADGLGIMAPETTRRILVRDFLLLVRACENGCKDDILLLLYRIEPVYLQWREEIGKLVNPHILC